LWPIPRGEEPNPNLDVPFQPAPISPYIVYPLTQDPVFPVAAPIAAPVPDILEDTADSPNKELAVFGSSEFAKEVLGRFWGNPPALDLAAEADLHTLLATLAQRKLLRSALDISDGGIAVALAQAAFPLGIGATVEQDQSLMVHPLFGLFAEPASTMFVSTDSSNVSAIEKLAEKYSFFAARIGITGGHRLEISVDGQPFISAPLDALRKLWASALEATLHDEVPA
jgi:phosphoribosylformylglycinamidine (FGAM) synthase-like enzyme